MGQFGWDMPPGVRESDIPGNRPEDVWGENFTERLLALYKDALMNGQDNAGYHLNDALTAMNAETLAAEVRAEVKVALNGPSRDGAGEFDHDEDEPTPLA